MKKYLLLALYLWLPIISISQNSFIKSYDVRGFAYNYVFTDHSFIMAGSDVVNASLRVMRCDSVGAVIWHKSYPYPMNFVSTQLNFLAVDSQGNIILGGRDLVPTGTSSFLVKLDPLGNLIWFKSYDHISGACTFYDLTISGNSWYIAAMTSTTGLIVKIDGNSGNVSWGKGFAVFPFGPKTTAIEIYNDTLHIGAISKNYDQSTLGSNYIFPTIIKMDTVGNVLSGTIMVDTVNTFITNFEDNVAGINCAQNGNVLLWTMPLESLSSISITVSPAVLSSESGSILWARGIGDIPGFSYISGAASDNDEAVFAYPFSFPAQSIRYPAVLKINSTGQVSFATHYSMTYDNMPLQLNLVDDSLFFLTVNDEFNLFKSYTIKERSAINNCNLFSSATTLPYQPQAQPVFSQFAIASQSLSVQNQQTIAASSTLSPPTTLCFSTLIEEVISNEFNITPNPAVDFIEINSSLPAHKLEIFSVTGALLIETRNLPQGNIRVNLEGVDKGLYFIQLTNDASLVRRKFLKM